MPLTQFFHSDFYDIAANCCEQIRIITSRVMNPGENFNRFDALNPVLCIPASQGGTDTAKAAAVPPKLIAI
jgi:hypothetical protein